jgi:SAM-dependent methyltransferase
MSSAAIWHEVECGGYTADLAVWEGLADSVEGPVLELGCGSGRVALHLARRGCEVWAVDAEPSLLEALSARAAAEGLAVHAACADVRALELDQDFGLIAAPMQLLQMMGGPAARRAALERSAAHLALGGRLAAAIVEPAAASLGGPTAALPDIRERDGWVYSSLPVAVGTTGGGVEIRRLRQAVSPDGSLSEEEHTDRLEALNAGVLEAEAASVGLRPAGRLQVRPGDCHVGSTVIIFGKA